MFAKWQNVCHCVVLTCSYGKTSSNWQWPSRVSTLSNWRLWAKLRWTGYSPGRVYKLIPVLLSWGWGGGEQFVHVFFSGRCCLQCMLLTLYCLILVCFTKAVSQSVSYMYIMYVHVMWTYMCDWFLLVCILQLWWHAYRHELANGEQVAGSGQLPGSLRAWYDRPLPQGLPHSPQLWVFFPTIPHSSPFLSHYVMHYYSMHVHTPFPPLETILHVILVRIETFSWSPKSVCVCVL